MGNRWPCFDMMHEYFIWTIDQFPGNIYVRQSISLYLPARLLWLQLWPWIGCAFRQHRTCSVVCIVGSLICSSWKPNLLLRLCVVSSREVTGLCLVLVFVFSNWISLPTGRTTSWGKQNDWGQGHFGVHWNRPLRPNLPKISVLCCVTPCTTDQTCTLWNYRESQGAAVRISGLTQLQNSWWWWWWWWW